MKYLNLYENFDWDDFDYEEEPEYNMNIDFPVIPENMTDDELLDILKDGTKVNVNSSKGKNMNATILGNYHSSGFVYYVIEFDDYIPGGHSGRGDIQGKNHHCWIFGGGKGNGEGWFRWSINEIL